MSFWAAFLAETVAGFHHFLIRNLSKIAIIETDCSEYRVILKTHYVVGLPPQFWKAVAWRHRHRKHEPLRIADASGAQSRAGRRARRNAVINHNRRAAGDLRAFAIAQVALGVRFRRIRHRKRI